MSITDFKDLADAIQSIVLTLAVVIGGLWTAYRFWSLQEIRKAKAELIGLQKTLTERGTLSISIEANSVKRLDGNGYYINVKASFTNVGNQTEVLKWSEGRVQAALVVGESEGEVIFGDWVETRLLGRLGPQVGATVAPSETIVFPFLIPVLQSGVYYIGLRVPGSPQETEATKRYAGSEPEDVITWASESYLLVN